MEHCGGNGLLSIKASILHRLRQAKKRIQRIRLNKVTRQTDEVTGIRRVSHTLCSCQKNSENVRIFFSDRALFQLSVISVGKIGIWLICLHECFYGHNIFIKLFYVLCLRTWLFEHDSQWTWNRVRVGCLAFGNSAISNFSFITRTRTILNSFFLADKYPLFLFFAVMVFSASCNS